MRNVMIEKSHEIGNVFNPQFFFFTQKPWNLKPPLLQNEIPFQTENLFK